MSYSVRQVKLRDEIDRVYPIWQRHYAEMEERMLGAGLECSPFHPRLDQYLRYSDDGQMLVFLLDCGPAVVGYAQGYITNDMHNGDLIAQEDAIYVVPEHRFGAGRILLNAVHAELKRRGVRRMNITTGTDLRAAKWFERRGYKHTAHCMTISF